MKSVPFFLFSLLATALLLVGCASVPKATGVTVTVTGFRPVAESSPVTTRAIMTLRFTSENVNAVGLTGSSHRLFLNGHYVGKAENTAPIGLPPQGTVSQDVTLDLEKPEIVRLSLSVAAEASYRLESVLYYTEGEDKLRIKTNYDGKIALQGLEAAAR